jgi:SAM-dependent methyltransferase
MKSLEIEKIDQVFTEIENWIQNDPEFLSSYWVPQRNRYKSDIQIINTFYEGGEILEVGSVPCYFTAMLKLLGYPVVGVDLFPQRAQLIIDRYGLTVQKCNIEAEPLPFPDGTFKYVLFTEVFEHLRVDPLLILSEINRVLTDGGLLMLSTPVRYPKNCTIHDGPWFW